MEQGELSRSKRKMLGCGKVPKNTRSQRCQASFFSFLGDISITENTGRSVLRSDAQQLCNRLLRGKFADGPSVLNGPLRMKAYQRCLRFTGLKTSGTEALPAPAAKLLSQPTAWLGHPQQAETSITKEASRSSRRCAPLSLPKAV